MARLILIIMLSLSATASAQTVNAHGPPHLFLEHGGSYDLGATQTGPTAAKVPVGLDWSGNDFTAELMNIGAYNAIDDSTTYNVTIQRISGNQQYYRIVLGGITLYAEYVTGPGINSYLVLDPSQGFALDNAFVSSGFWGVPATYPAPSTIRVELGGDPAWLLLEGGGGGTGGSGGVDADDWDYWFDEYEGRFQNLYGGLVQWFGDGAEDEGTMRTDMDLIHDNFESMLAKLDTIIYAMVSPIPPIDPTFGDEALNAVVSEIETSDWDVSSLQDEVETTFEKIEITGTDSEDSDITIQLPLSSWLSDFDAGVQDMDFTINTGPFDSVRGYLHAFIFAALGVWGVLRIFEEFRRYA